MCILTLKVVVTATTACRSLNVTINFVKHATLKLFNRMKQKSISVGPKS